MIIIITPIVLCLLGIIVLRAYKKRNKSLKGTYISPSAIASARASENVGGKEEEGTQIYKSDLY